jgi:hypothetical protein
MRPCPSSRPPFPFCSLTYRKTSSSRTKVLTGIAETPLRPGSWQESCGEFTYLVGLTTVRIRLKLRAGLISCAITQEWRT